MPGKTYPLCHIYAVAANPEERKNFVVDSDILVVFFDDSIACARRSLGCEKCGISNLDVCFTVIYRCNVGSR